MKNFPEAEENYVSCLNKHLELSDSLEDVLLFSPTFSEFLELVETFCEEKEITADDCFGAWAEDFMFIYADYTFTKEFEIKVSTVKSDKLYCSFCKAPIKRGDKAVFLLNHKGRMEKVIHPECGGKTWQS